jgi:antitoxin MazE
MKTCIVKLGNSRGVRIPKALLDLSGLSGPVEMEAQPGQLIVRTGVKAVRQGWDAAFQRMAASGDDALLDEEAFTASRWDEGGWRW